MAESRYQVPICIRNLIAAEFHSDFDGCSHLLVYSVFSQTEHCLFIFPDIQLCRERLIFLMIVFIQIAEELAPFADNIHQAFS